MTHLSDFSYLQRDAQEIYLTTFLLIRMWQADGFKCLSPRRVINGELRSIVTWFMFLLMIAQASWDFLCTYIKYKEGFMQVAPGMIISKPFEAWSVKNQDPIEVMNYIQCVTFSLQVSILLLLQMFWNYLSNTVAKKNFMSSKEFTVYIVWTIGTIAMFPILQYFYKHTHLEEVVPQTAYSCEVLVVAILGFRNHARFNRLIRAATRNGKRPDVYVTDRLTYFRDMNLLLSLALVAFGGSMFILCIDGFTTNKVINSNKFAADLLICNANITSIFLWLIIISIFHPTRVPMEGKRTTTDQSGSHDVPKKNAVTHQPLNNTDTPGSARGLLSPVGSSSPPLQYTHNSNGNKKQHYAESIQGLNQEFNDDNTMGYLSSSPPISESNTQSTLTFGGKPQPHERSNVVSIDDPFAKESITFSMIKPSTKNDSHTITYASAVDYYGVNINNTTSPSVISNQSYHPSTTSSHAFRSTTASPPPNQELPSVPGAYSTNQRTQQHYY